MFEPWKRFDARKAAALLNKHRKILRREHARLHKFLRHKPKDQKAADISEQIRTLRQTWRDAAIDQICVCRALDSAFFTVNLANYVNAFRAQVRLFVTCNEVEKTLQKLSPTSKSSSARP